MNVCHIHGFLSGGETISKMMHAQDVLQLRIQMKTTRKLANSSVNIATRVSVQLPWKNRFDKLLDTWMFQHYKSVFQNGVQYPYTWEKVWMMEIFSWKLEKHQEWSQTVWKSSYVWRMMIFYLWTRNLTPINALEKSVFTKSVWKKLQIKIQTHGDSFLDIQEIIFVSGVPQVQRVNKKYYREFLDTLRERVRRKRPQLWKNVWVLHQDIFPVHSALIVK